MERELSVACEALESAARVCRAVQADLVPESAVEKPDRSPVTVADFASQAIVCQAVSEAFPDDPIVAEESAATLRQDEHRQLLDQVVHHTRSIDVDITAEQVLGWIDRGAGQAAARFWTLDPIDGTKGFLRRGQYAVALALIEHGQVILGALACPELAVDPAAEDGERGVLCYAVRGAGAWGRSIDGDEDAVRIHTDAVATAAGARFVESVESGHANQEAHARIAALLGIELEPLRMDSQAKYAAVARGDASIYLRLPSPRTPDYRERIWDHAAGMCIVEEAGGRVSDARGEALDFSRGDRLLDNLGVVGTSGPCHDSVIRACLEAQPVA